MTMDFDLTLERIQAHDASVGQLFESDGNSVRGLGRVNMKSNPVAYTEKLQRTARFVQEVYSGKRPIYHFKEAMTTSDFPALFGDVLDRQLLAQYREAPYTWGLYTHRSTVRDFREVKRFRLDGGTAVLPAVPEQNPYEAAALTDDVYTYRVNKYGRRIPLSWETTINDDLGALRDIPNLLGRAARRSEERFVTERFVDSSGPHASVFTVGNGNIITGNPVLSMAALSTARTVLSKMRDTDGEPIVVDNMILVVPPALEVTALNTVNATAVELTTDGGTPDNSGGGIRLHTANWLGSRLRVAVNPYIPIVATTNGDTSWFLFAEPNSGRPAIEIGFLVGHEEPMITMKAPNQIAVSGGGGTIMEDFDFDTVQYRIRHVFGGAIIDPIMVVGSDGTGS